MRRAVVLLVGFGLFLGCRRPQQQQQVPPTYQGGYYPPPQHQPYPPGHYPPPPQGYPPSYHPPPPPPPSYHPPPPPPAPAPAPAPGPAPAPAPNPANDWINLLGGLLNGGAPPPNPAPAPAPTTPPPPPPPSTTIPPIEPRALDLANAINTYRAQNGLPAIPISRSLSYVAATHVKDLRESPKVGAQCNGHSWTSKGPWTACCYTADHAQAKCMWDKPLEVAKFKATGFEITIGQPGELSGVVLDSNKAISMWQGSPLHNEVILNKGTWQKTTWRSMGAGIVDSHACAWFSDQPDPVH